ncbi:zinc finger protein 470-like [Aricia agestis]|uniref:zinc finger protein 470-like n=1 Tax=Aricia agestis TaxID=91739 RepID=UPI001C203957|nr:zinc finger protein 470-like [Aricia agestis]XP_041969907.1 zinc finger protein 470-like [Aricia agestis]
MESWSNLCRCCLSPNSEVSLLNNEDNIREKFLEVTTIEVSEDDGLPQKLCVECFSTMTSAYQFRTQCLKMDKELKVQLNIITNQNKEPNSPQFSQIETQVKGSADMTIEDIAKESMKQIEKIIKTEPCDDDDTYYVLVIDDPKDSELQCTVKKENAESKLVPEIIKNVKQEKDIFKYDSENTETKLLQSTNQFENCVDSFLMANSIPNKVPATILENEEQDSEQNYEMDVDTTQEQTEEQELSFVQGDGLTILENPPNTGEDSQETLNDFSIALARKDLDRSKNIIKILSPSGGEQAIFLKNGENIKYLTDSQLVDAGDDVSQDQQVILCEGEEGSQFQILKCDGSELVIEYSDDSQIATVLQQEDGTFLCDCGEQFEDLTQYEEHQHTHQYTSTADLTCHLCGKSFETSEVLAGHMVLHSVNTLLVKCLFCNQFVKRNGLTQHIKYVHNSKPKCNVCWKTFANLNNLKRHMLIHKGVKDFECDICNKKFAQKITMQTHKLTHVNPLVCTQCGCLFEDQESLATHKDGLCKKTMTEKVDQIKEDLMKTVKQEVTTSSGKLLGYACSICKKMYSLESAIEQHIENVHIEKLDVAFEDQSQGKKTVKRFPCGTCGKGCASQAMLIMHERVHTNERPFPCQLCSLRFKTKTHLRTHQLTHTREKKFGCSVCMKFFALKGNLVVHLRTHTGERPYQCNLCNEAFIDSKYLKKHKLKKHAIENVPWNQYTIDSNE